MFILYHHYKDFSILPLSWGFFYITNIPTMILYCHYYDDYSMLPSTRGLFNITITTRIILYCDFKKNYFIMSLPKSYKEFWALNKSPKEVWQPPLSFNTAKDKKKTLYIINYKIYQNVIDFQLPFYNWYKVICTKWLIKRQ